MTLGAGPADSSQLPALLSAPARLHLHVGLVTTSAYFP